MPHFLYIVANVIDDLETKAEKVISYVIHYSNRAK